MGTLKTWSEMQATTYPPTLWHVQELIPVASTVLLWGAESIGKTPICWYLGRAIAEGKPFFGLPTRKGRVVFIELDMPEQMTAMRTAQLRLPEEMAFFHDVPVDNFDRDRMAEKFASAIATAPDVVFVDSLRKCHPLDDKASENVTRVYETYRAIFPGATVVFIHHERKLGVDDHRPNEESYSGSRAWSNNAQVGIRVSRHKGEHWPLRLAVTKNQGAERDWHMRFKLTEGVHLRCEMEQREALREIIETVQEPKERIEAIQKKYGCSRATAYRWVGETMGQ